MFDIQKDAGKWKIFEKETLYQGELYIDYKNHIIALEILIPASEGNPLPSPPYKGKIPYICGTLFSGTKILLYDCSTGRENSRFMQYTKQIIYAKYSFLGLLINSIEEIKFKKVIFDFGNIIAWSGLCNYNWEFSNEGGSDLKWVHKEPVKFKVRENLEVVFLPSQGSVGIGDIFESEIKARQYISVEFTYSNFVEWEVVKNDALSMQYLIGIGTNQRVEINSAKYCHSSIYIELPKVDNVSEKIYEPVDVIFGTGEVEATQNTNSYDFLYTLSDIKKNDIFVRWNENYSMLKPVLDLYFIAFSNTIQSPEMLFLNLMQALETYHARFITDDAKSYPQRVNSLVESFCQGNSNIEEWRTFLLDNGQAKNTNNIYLRSRLADLVFANGELPFWPQKCFPEEYIRKIIDTRNYYTHYDQSKFEKAFSKEELPCINEHLLALLQYHLLILMGFDVKEVKNKTIKKINKIDYSYRIRQHTHDIER